MGDKDVERVELGRIAGQMLPTVEYLDGVCRVKSKEGIGHHGLAVMLDDLEPDRFDERWWRGVDALFGLYRRRVGVGGA